MSQQESPSQVKRFAMIGVWGVIAVLLVLFIANNSQSVEFSIAFTVIAMPLWALVVIVLAIGVGAGWLTRWWTARR